MLRGLYGKLRSEYFLGFNLNALSSSILYITLSFCFTKALFASHYMRGIPFVVFSYPAHSPGGSPGHNDYRWGYA
jgi:hypothetical protein